MNRHLATLCALLLWPTSAMAAPLTPEKIYQNERPTAVSLSPDASYLAVVVSRGDVAKNKSHSETRLYAFPPQGDQPKPVVTLPGASNFKWSPANSGPLRCLYTKTDGEHSQAFLYNVIDGSNRQLTKQSGGVGTLVWSPQGDKFLYTARVAPVRPISPVSSDGNSGRLYDDLFVRRWNRYHDGKFEHLFLQSLESGSQAKDLTPADRDFGPTSSTFSGGDNCCFSGDGSKVFYSAPPARGSAYDTNYDVYQLDLKTGQTANLTAGNPAADFGPRLSADGQKVYYWSHQRVGYESERAQIKSISLSSGQISLEEGLNRPLGVSEWISTTSGAIYSYLDKEQYRLGGVRAGQQFSFELAGRGPHSLSVDSSSRLLACTTTSMQQTPRVEIVDLTTGQSRVFPAVAPPADLELSSNIEQLTIPVEGGEMGVWVIKPRQFDPQKKWPVALLIHGGPQGAWSNDWSSRWNAQVWAARGYVVVMPNPRGSSSRSLKFQDEVSRNWGSLPYQDLMKCLDHIESLPYIDKSRVLAAGASFGGYMVNWLSVHTGRFKALVTHCGVWNLDSMYGTTDEVWFSDWEFGGAPWGPQRPMDYDKFSPHRMADKLAVYKTPHLVIHNDLDFRCPINQGLELFTALQRQGVPSRFLNFPDEGHWVTKPGNSVRWYKEVFQFVEQHCPPGPR